MSARVKRSGEARARLRCAVPVSLSAVVLLSAGCSLFRPMPSSVPIHHAASSSGRLEAGAAAVDITPEEDLWLGGYGILRTGDGVHDPLYARALVLKRGPLELALVAVDLVGLQYEDIARIQQRMEGIDPRQVVITSTHTHSGPDTVGLWGFPPCISGIDAAYLERVENGILQALQAARASLQPAEVGGGAVLAEPEGFIKNLRIPGLVDREVVVLHLRQAGGGKTIATLVELGCHPEVLGRRNRQVTSDFPHWTRERLERKLDGTAIYVSGALGALVTPDTRDAGADAAAEWLEAERIGGLLADHALRALSDVKSYSAEPELALWHAPVYLPNRNFLYEFARWTGMLSRTRYRWGYYRTEVNLWRIGDFHLATVPGEITPGLGLRIKSSSPGRKLMIVGLANDELGYFLPQEEYDLPIYSYERTLCPGYDGGERLVRRLEDLLRLSRE